MWYLVNETCVYLKYLLFQLLFVQGTALLMMIELVKSVISHARVIVSDFFFSLNGSFRLSACFFYLSMYIYVFVKCKWDRCMSGFDKPTRVVYDTFKQTIIFSICIENLKYRQVGIQTNKKKTSNNQSTHEWKLLLPWGWIIMLRKITFFTTWLQHMIDDYDLK
jgi:hypothetical protein